jgi:cell division protein FtsQ
MTRRAQALRRGLPLVAAGVAAPADRRFRRPDVRPGRHRRIRQIVWRVSRPILIGLGAIAGGYWLAGVVLASWMFNVDQITVRGTVRLAASDVEALVADVRGQNILRVDLDRTREQLLASSWIAGATMSRVLPSTLEIHIVERTPMVLARVGQQLHLVDDAGVIIDTLGGHAREFDLPIVDGLVRSPSRGVLAADAERVALTKRLMDALAQRPDLRQRLSQVDVSSAHDAVVLLDRDPTLLHLGDRFFVERMRAYLDLAPALRERLGDIDYVDLRFEERLYVRARGQAKAARVQDW